MAYNTTRFQHSVVSGATMPLNQRNDTRYKNSPLFGYSPDIPKAKPTTIFSINFSTGVPQDRGKFKFDITENNNPAYKNNSPFNGLSLYVPAGSDSLCYLPYDIGFVVDRPVFVDAWVYINNVKGSGTNQILSSRETGNLGIGVEDGYLKGYIRIDGSEVPVVSTKAFVEKIWTYVGLSYTGKRIALFEGADEYIVGAVGPIDLVSNPMVIGGEWTSAAIDTDYSLDGYIAYVGMHKRGRNLREVERYLTGL